MIHFCTRLGIGLLFMLLALNVATNLFYLPSNLGLGVGVVSALPQAPAPSADSPSSPMPGGSSSAPSTPAPSSPSPSSSSDPVPPAPSSGGNTGSSSSSGSGSTSTPETDTKPSSQPTNKPTSSDKPSTTITLPTLTHTVTSSLTTTITSISTDADGNSMTLTVTATATPGATSFTVVRADASAPTQISQKQCDASKNTCLDVICPGHKIDFRCELTIQCACRPLSDDDSNSAFAALRTTLFKPWSTKTSDQFDHMFILLSLLFGGVLFIMVATDDFFAS